MDKGARKSHYVVEGTLSLSIPPSFPLYVRLELVRSSAGLQLWSRQAPGMQVRPLKPVQPATEPAPFHWANLPIHLQWDLNFICPRNTTLTTKELEMHYQPAPKLGLLPS